MLFAVLSNGGKDLVDLGSKKNGNIVSSYLGELEGVVWACKKLRLTEEASPYSSERIVTVYLINMKPKYS